MRKMWKKGFVLAAVVSMLAGSVLTGCGNSPSQAGGQAAPAQQTQAKKEESKDTAKKDEGAGSASQTDWPTGPVQIIVGANAGGGIDTAARIIAKYMEQEMGQSFVVSNVAGGAGSIAANQVKTAKPDGNTMLVCHEALLTNKISGTTDFDDDAFASGGIPFKVYTTCLLSKKYATFEELIEAAKANPGTLKFGTELATNDTAIIAMIEEKYDTQFQLVDAGAVSDQIASMMGDHMDFMKAPVGLVKDYVASGDFHILAFFNDERYDAYPDVPTMKELGVDFIVDKFFFCGFPLGTDQAVIDKFSDALERICQNPDFIADADNVMYAVEYVAPEDTTEYFADCKTRLVKYQEILDNHYQ